MNTRQRYEAARKAKRQGHSCASQLWLNGVIAQRFGQDALTGVLGNPPKNLDNLWMHVSINTRKPGHILTQKALNKMDPDFFVEIWA